MGDRSREVPHSCDAVRMRQLHLNLAVSLLDLTFFGFRPLAFRQIEHESDTLVPRILQARRTDQDGHAAAILAKIFFLECLRGAGHFHLLNRLSVAVPPFRRRQVRPRMRPEMRSSRSYPNIWRNASLASMIRPSRP